MKTTKFLLILLAALALAACTFQVSVGSTATPVPSMTAEIPTDTAVALASPTGVSQPTATGEVPTPTLILPAPTLVRGPSPTPVPTQATEQNIKIFLIALEDNGRSGTLVGCGDSAVPITVTIPRTQAVLRAALEKLLSEKAQYYGESGLYNALYQSNLRLAGLTIEQGKAIIHLAGSIRLGGTCDAPRLQAQIEQTALQFSTVQETTVFVNDVPLAEVLSQK